MNAGDARRLAAGLLCVGFPGPQLDEPTRSLLRGGAAGVILFTRNWEDCAQIRALAADVTAAAGRRVIVAVDHEGGRVQRFRGPGFTDLPPMRLVGAGGDPSMAEAMGATAARELRAVGITLDFAPVLDVDSNPANPVIGDRSFGRAPEVVAAMGAAFVRGLQGGGVAGCGKHFPGHGDTEQDSHLDLPRLPHDAERLRRVELPPFRAAIQAGVASIMTAHVVFQAVDPDVPATMSRRVLQDILRGELGFRGAIVSDDLEMKAIADRMDLGEAALRAVEAGVDLLLCCHEAARQERIVAALAEAIASGRLPEARVRESLAHIQPLAGTA